MRPKASAPPTAEQQRYHHWLRQRGKCEAGGSGDLVIHHILAFTPGKQGRRDHWYVVLISATLHNISEKSVHGLGSESKFLREHGVDLVAVARLRLAQWKKGEGNELEGTSAPRH